MKLENKPDFLEIFKTYIAPPNSERPGDTRLEVSFQVQGFSGSSSCWVEDESLREFHSAVSDIYSNFRGSALLESMSPEELHLSLSIANPRGYVLVQVKLGKRIPGCSVSGSFEVPLQDVFSLAQWAISESLETT